MDWGAAGIRYLPISLPSAHCGDRGLRKAQEISSVPADPV